MEPVLKILIAPPISALRFLNVEFSIKSIIPLVLIAPPAPPTKVESPSKVEFLMEVIEVSLSI